MPGGVPGILPFVRLSYASPSTYSWWDDEGQRRTVVQAEGGEQGDPTHAALVRNWDPKVLWRKSARPSSQGSSCAAFLDDVFALCDPERVKAIHDTFAECLWRVAGIQLHRREDQGLEQRKSSTSPCGPARSRDRGSWKVSRSWEHPLGVQLSAGRG